MSHYHITIPGRLINTVLKVVHDSQLGGHCGINNPLDRAKEHFFFHEWEKFGLCTILSLLPNKTSKHAIASSPVPVEPFKVWQLDLCRPYPVYGITVIHMSLLLWTCSANSFLLILCEIRTL